jgi:tetratricopeptide (TPR) repeat protein
VGRYREASRVFDNARREAEVGGNIDEQGALFLLSAQLAIERKDYGRAAQDCDAAERVFVRLPNERQRVPRVLVHTLRGIAQVGAGRIGEARRHSAAQAREFNAAVEPENWWHHALEGEIALAGGDPAGAAAAFAAGQPARRMWFGTLRMSLTILANHLVSRDGLARVAKAQGDPARAIQIYKQLLAFGREQKFVPVFEPRYELQIGRLLEQAGEGRGALRAYERFLELWQNADAGLPELGEARGAVARLSPRP